MFTPIPVTVLSGFLGAGKTTLLRHLLKEEHGLKIAVIENEFSDAGVDTQLLGSEPVQVMTLSNGCVCCTIHTDLTKALVLLLERLDSGEIAFDRLVIECTGLADPAPILHTVMLHPYLVLRYRLESVVTLIDSINGLSTLDAHEEARRQAAVADRLVLTKTDLIESDGQRETFDALRDRLNHLNPGARRLDAHQGEATPANLFNAGLYNPDSKIPDVAKWLNAEAYEPEAVHDHSHLHGHHHHHHGHDHHHHDHGHSHEHDVNRHDDKIRAFTLSTSRPVPASALEMFLDLLRSAHGPKLLRVKGIVQIAEDPDRPVVIHGVQHVFHPPATLDAWPDGDHSTRMVFITYDLAEGFVRKMFEAFSGALLPDTPDPKAMTDNPLAISGFTSPPR